MDELPEGLELVRVTPEFDEASVPPALLAAHRIATGVWGRLVVREGSVGFRFEPETDGSAESELSLQSGAHVVIPPERAHRVVLHGPTRFVVEFHRRPPDD